LMLYDLPTSIQGGCQKKVFLKLTAISWTFITNRL
jgi:hypothetical protein